MAGCLVSVNDIRYTIHVSYTNLFMGIARNSKFIEYDIAMRQLAMKTHEKSWFYMVRSILGTYLRNKCQNQNGRES